MQFQPRKTWRLLLCSLAILSTSACKKSVYPGGISSSDWDDGGPIAGLDHASVICGTWPGGKAAIIFWADAVSGGGDALPPVLSGGKRAVWQAHFRTADGRPIECSCDSPGGISGAVTIDHHDFDLSKGGFFLISTADAQTRIKQLDRDPSKLALTNLQSLTTTDAEIQSFFKAR